MHEARYYKTIDQETIQCGLCPHSCLLKSDEVGRCHGRKHQDGKMSLLYYNEVVSLAMDPIEKKPLYHFKPGQMILSTASNACNFECSFCQNWQISQHHVSSQHLTSDQLVQTMLTQKSIGVAFTYTEPFVWFEYIFDAAKKIKEKGGVVVLVSNGYINEKPLNDLIPLIDAINVDLKSMDPQFYEQHCGARLKPVLKNIERLNQARHITLEVTNLVIPSLNDSDEHFAQLIGWLGKVNPSIPLHISAYFPAYRAHYPPTPSATLQRFFEQAKDSLHYVYAGNIFLPDTENTYCPACHTLLIERRRYAIVKNDLVQGNQCPKCHYVLNVQN